MDLKHELKAEAHRLGFLLAGVTLPVPPPHIANFERWLAAGHHAGMTYLAAERARLRRADPALILPEARSILCLALPYTPPESPAPTSGARVAAYAAGPDYHELIPPRLAQLVEFAERRLGRTVTWRAYTDTGPILERDLALQAGLGWIGKNTCLISPEAGSYFFLSEIFWDIQLSPDAPLAHDYCGSCRRCIAACPTGCILPDRTLDAARCISYLTIEHKGVIPADLRPQLQNWVFGCDICQQVCPWNIRFAPAHGDPAFTPEPSVIHPNLSAELRLSAVEFNQKFRASPIRRAKRRGYLRNAAVILGNLRSPAAVPALLSALLGDPEPLVRAHAAWALGQIAVPAAREALRQAQTQESDAQVLDEIIAALRW